MTIKLTPYLTLEAKSKEAIAFYEQALGAELLYIVTYGDMPDIPDSSPDALKSLVAHAKLRVGGSELMLSDAPLGNAIPQGKQVTICITTEDAEEGKRIFEALAQDGKVNMPFEQTSFSPGFGDLTDRFGVTFQISTEVKA
ncbi:VOC family protein [Paenibacillus sp. 598K]|uniref:VOC family protein n=1 Tax=Paenibacillus sp. 598K TaxID=1117987 RepID=UPI000FF95F30|nr:VOC family protein [Paenibacillus sp. 598K]GBF71844.1 VOC family protein [Paenibacillus sp. 598K]